MTCTTEVDKLLQSADTQARELLGTLGYFSPLLQWQREAANAQVLLPP